MFLVILNLFQNPLADHNHPKNALHFLGPDARHDKGAKQPYQTKPILSSNLVTSTAMTILFLNVFTKTPNITHTQT